MNKSILFWDLNNKGMGGIERLILTLMEEFSKTREVKLIARKEGIVYRTLLLKHIKFTYIDYEQTSFNNSIAYNDLLITFGTYREFVKLKKQNPKVLVWRVYPSLVLQGPIQTWLMRLTFKSLDKKDSLVFMDRTNLRQCSSELQLKLKGKILPIPLKSVDIKKIYKPYDGNEFSISYIGRGNLIWKVKSVKRLVKDLGECQNKFFIVHIFTDSTELFEKEIRDFIKNNVTVRYYLNYVAEKLSNELISVSHLHYSMGTSALEGAVLGIPTLIADAGFMDFPDAYRYRFLNDDLENYAGCFIDDKIEFNGTTISNIIGTLENKGIALKLSAETKAIAMNLFSPEKICSEIDKLEPVGRIKDILKNMPAAYFESIKFRTCYNKHKNNC